MQSILAVKDYPRKEWIIWVGAGVSHQPPSCLPLGREMTEFALTTACGDGIREKILSVWQEADMIAARPDNATPFGVIPRLETVLGEIDRVQERSINCSLDYMAGFSSFCNPPYNDNHLMLASLLSEGATIVTTNFDLCIQSAYRCIQGRPDHLVIKPGKVNCYISSQDRHIVAYSRDCRTYPANGCNDQVCDARTAQPIPELLD